MLAVISASANPVTLSLKVKVAVNALFVVEPATFDVITTDGGVASNVVVKVGAAPLLLPAASCAAFAAIFNVTAPSLIGVTTAVYIAPLLDDIAPTVAFIAITSLAVKPVTLSLNVKVAVNALFMTEPPALEVMTTLGAVASNDVAKDGAAVLTLPAASCATFAGIFMLTAPSLTGVMVAV